MREFKFRSWIKKENKIIYDFDLMDNNRVAENDKDVIMQYTGFKDKNGKEMYEGDLVENKRGTVAEVIFHNYGFCLDSGFLKLPLFKFNSFDELEVIGNIYERGVISE